MDTKGLFASKTFWGMIVMFVAFALNKWFGINLSEETHGIVTDELVNIAGAALIIYGRIKAERKISGI